MKLLRSWLAATALFFACPSRVALGQGPAAEAAVEEALAAGDIDVTDAASLRPGPRPLPLAPEAGHRLEPRAHQVLPEPRASTYVTIGAFRRDLESGNQERGVFLVLGIPFDRFARGRRATTFLSPAPEAGLPGMLETAGLATTGSVASPETPTAFELALTPRLARACVDAAWRAAGFSGDEAALDAIISRAHWSAALPEARLRAVRYDDALLSLDTGADTSRLRDSAGANLGLEARLTWRLDRLVYADDEPAFERIRLEHRDARGRLATKVLEALFHWQRALLDLRTLPPAQVGTRDEADVVLRMMEAEAALDVLTDGWFAAHKRDGEREGRDGGARTAVPLRARL